eukprot:TRINITY_DN6839_c0_g5_i1.p1 TRINITY_DN6839_c0_g5~~TRINITY_DN6839_c0_g5_i1.p1  ORF type:complete len:889 (+),score=254.29 TRINITY_DN6839_c0_g5_i1:81-2669(+)
MVFGRLARWLADLSARPEDSPADRARKALAAPVYLAGSIFCFIAFLTNQDHASMDEFYELGIWNPALLLCTAAGAVGLALTLATRVKPSTVATGLVLAITLAILAVDLNAAATGTERWWSFLVLALDLALVMNVPDWAQRVVIACTVLYFAVERVESITHFGFYWIAFGGDVPLEKVVLCDCAAVPCKRSTVHAATDWACVTFIFLTDFMLTRGFALGQRRQVALVDASVETAERVAVQLAAYSVAEAERIVASDGQKMPPALRDAMALLLTNLKRYRPYLPDALLHQAAEELGADLGDPAAGACEIQAVEPPGSTAGGTADVSLCFTDIQSSTALWEAYPQDMYDALQIHNGVIRRLAAACGGYECKTIGDAFMLCFASVEGACRFALDTQRQLLRQEWPPELTQHELCRPALNPERDDELLWHGLRVRVGVNCGSARVQPNPITGRYDYFGGTVNVAARVEAAVQRGGLVGVTDSVLAALGSEGLSRLGNPVVTPIGSKELKGVREPVALHLMLPPELAARAAAPAAAEPQPGHSPRAAWAASTAGSLRRHSSVQSGSTPRQSAGNISFSSHQSTLADPCSPTDGALRFAATPLGALTLRLQHAEASCTFLRTPLGSVLEQEGRLAPHYAAVDSAVDASGGVVAAVLSAEAVVSWNAARACANHARACARFMGTILQDPRAIRSHCGAASGRVASGNIAAGRRRFATVIGGCMELAAALAEEAELCGDGILAQGPVVRVFADTGQAFWAQLWRDGDRPQGFVVWEVVLDRPHGRNDTIGADSLLAHALAQEECEEGGDAHPLRVFCELAGMEREAQLAAIQQRHDELQGCPAARRLLLRATDGALRTRRLPHLPQLLLHA